MFKNKLYILLLYNKLLFRIQDKIKPIGLVFLGKFGDLIYRSSVITFTFFIFTIFISILFPLIATSSLLVKTDAGINFVFVSFALLLSLLIFEFLFSNESSAPFFRIISRNTNSIDFYSTIFLCDFFSIKIIVPFILFLTTYLFNTSIFISNLSVSVFILIFYYSIYFFVNMFISSLRIGSLFFKRSNKTNIILGNTILILIIFFGDKLISFSNNIFILITHFII